MKTITWRRKIAPDSNTNLVARDATAPTGESRWGLRASSCGGPVEPGPSRSRPVVLVAVDFQDASLKAAQHALALARQMNGDVVLLHISDAICSSSLLNLVTRQKVAQEARRRALEKLEGLAGSRTDPGLSVTCIVREGLPEYEIFRLAESMKAGLIVLGRSRRSVLSRWLWGGVSDNLLDIASCPVVVVNDRTPLPFRPVAKP